jgi:hypothetical protein
MASVLKMSPKMAESMMVDGMAALDVKVDDASVRLLRASKAPSAGFDDGIEF